MEYMDIGQKLKKARIDAKLTQEELSEKISVSRQTISSWENGRSYPDIVSIILLSDIYKISLDVLLKGDDLMIKKLKESTDVVKSTKKLMIIYTVWIIGFGLLYIAQQVIHFPKMDNIFLNSLILFIAFIALLYQLFKNVNIKKILEGNTSNKVIARIIIVLCYITLIFIILPIINFFITVEWQVTAARLIVCFLLIIPCYLLFKKI